jgi:cytochrome c
MKTKLVILAAGLSAAGFALAQAPAKAPAAQAPAAGAPVAAPGGVLVGAPPGPGRDLLQKNNCTTACHQVDKKVVGPAYWDVALRYKGDAAAPARLAAKVKAGGTGVWDPYMPMTPNPQVSDADMKVMIAYILALKPPANYKPAPLPVFPAAAPAAAPAKK